MLIMIEYTIFIGTLGHLLEWQYGQRTQYIYIEGFSRMPSRVTEVFRRAYGRITSSIKTLGRRTRLRGRRKKGTEVSEEAWREADCYYFREGYCLLYGLSVRGESSPCKMFKRVEQERERAPI